MKKLNVGDTLIVTNIIEDEELEFMRTDDEQLFSVIGGDNDDGYVSNGIRIVEGLP